MNSYALLSEPTLECDALEPHPDAVYTGTCPAPSGWSPPPGWEPPSPDPGLTTEPQPTDADSSSPDTTTTAAVPPPSHDGGALPVTGTSLGGLLGVGLGLLLVGVVVLAWVRRRGRLS